MEKRDLLYLKRIVEATLKAESFVVGMDKGMFMSDEKTQSAVIMQLALIGELVKKLSVNVKDSIDLPWKDIAGFRDRAIHNYFEIDLDVVWNTVTSDLVVVRTKISKVA